MGRGLFSGLKGVTEQPYFLNFGISLGLGVGKRYSVKSVGLSKR